MTYSNADFTPGMKGYSDIKPFRFWCQKVLPLVYDDSLSYYELLCKVTDYINNIITDLATTEENVGSLLDAYNQLQDYVNNYFTNLDVQEEINNKLDAMFEDGTIPTMIEEYVYPYIETLNNNYAELDSQINATMDTQNENIATLTTRVNNLVINNTTNLTGYNVVTVESTTAQGGSTVTENIPKNAEILQVCYSGYNDTNDTIKSDNISYESTPNTPSSTQQQVVVTITDATDTRFNVFITYAISQAIEIAELTDIRVGYDDTVYPSAGNAVRGQISDLKNAINDDFAFMGVSITDINIDTYDTINVGMQSNNQWAGIGGTAYKSALVTDISNYIKVTANSIGGTFISFFKQVPTEPQSATDEVYFCDGETGRHQVIKDETETFAVPSDCECIVVGVLINGSDRTPIIKEYTVSGGIVDNIYDTINIGDNEIQKNIDYFANEYRYDDLVTSSDVISSQEAFVSDDGSIHSQSGAYLYKVSCVGYEKLNYKNSKAVSNHLAVAFYDINDVFLFGGSQAFSSDATYDIPNNASYVFIASSRNQTGFFDESIVVFSKTKYEITDINAFGDDTTTSYISTTINEPKALADAINTKWNTYASSCLVANQSFFNIPREWTIEQMYEQINRNFRDNVCSPKYSIEQNIVNINKAFAQKIRRFMDAKLNTGTRLDFSLPTGLQADEPSVIVSNDGSKMYIYAHLKRIYTEDGVNWSQAENLTLSDNGYIQHCGVNKIDDTYYLIGTTSNDAQGNLVLYTSSDGLNFTYKGILFKPGYQISSNKTELYWGNPYLIKEYGSGKFYLYIETQSIGEYWEINLVKCTNILQTNADGTIGDWVISSNNPIISAPFNAVTSANTSAGNADFAKGTDNRPIMHDGKYYLYFHSTISNVANIARACSTDLENWTVEGNILDVRDTPTGGDNTIGNADHCIIEFKGRTYMFYSWNINDPNNDPYIKYTVDDRPMLEMLKLRP